ncbi:MAG TPA: hypothetical protein VIB39_05775 [Candidatus Angelobacter sp.]|jgi:hypothetical protein
MKPGTAQNLCYGAVLVMAVIATIGLHAQTPADTQPARFILQKDFDDLTRSAGKIRKEEVPAFEQRASGGDPQLQLVLGTLYQQGCGTVSSDIKTALNWYHKAADQGSSMALNQIGVHYDAGSGRDKAQALQWYRRAAERGDNAVAEHNLGEMLTESGQPKDLAEGLVWLRRSVQHGFDRSIDDLLALYENGRALPGKSLAENQKAGLDLLQGWADQGNATAQIGLAMAYWKDLLGTGKRPTEAIEWMTKAADKSADAEAYLGWFRSQETGVSTRNDEAVRWYRKSAEHGSALGQTQLAYVYEHGLGVPKDPAEAARWTQLAAEHGDPAARYHLAEMYESGRGVRKDKVTALMWFILAQAAGAPDFMRELHPSWQPGGFAFYRHPYKKDYEEANRRAEQRLCL